MKILQIIDTLAVGGAEKVLITLANIQQAKGDTVTVLTLLSPGVLANQLDPEIQVLSLERKWKFNPVTMYRFVCLARNYDLVHVHSSHNLRYVFLATLLFGLKKPIFFHEHFGNIEIDKSFSWHQRLIYPSVNLIGVSQSICDWAIQQVGVPKGKTHLLHNIIPSKPHFLKPFAKEKNQVSILVTGNILRTKNIAFALRFFAAFNLITPGKLTIIGQKSDPEYFQELQEIIIRLNLEGKVHFMHDCFDIQPILSQFDAAIHTPLFESGPLVLIEYVAQGLPFLSYKTGEIALMVEGKFPNLIIDNFQIDFWIEAMNKLLSQNRSVLGRELRLFFEDNFSEEDYYKKCQHIYKSVIHF